MKGRKPTPISRQMADGDPRKIGAKKLKERLNAEPKAARGLPDPPAHLKGLALEVWRFWDEELEAMELAKRPDGVMLEGACVNYARAVSADTTLESEGMIVEESGFTKAGDVVVLRRKAHPAIAISANCWKLVRSFCSEFGLSPIARQRLAVKSEDTASEDLAELLSRPRGPRQEEVVH